MVWKQKCGGGCLRLALPVPRHSARETEVWPGAECVALTPCLPHAVILRQLEVGILRCLGMVPSTSRIWETHSTGTTGSMR